MVVLQAFVLTLLLVGIGHEFIRKHTRFCRLAAVFLSCFTVFGVWSGLFAKGMPRTNYVLPLLSQGALGGMFFIFVMYAGALPKKSVWLRRLMPIRGELSILASILTFGHNLAYGKTYFVRLFSSVRLSQTVTAAAVCSLLMIVIMLPLFITSFPSVRKKMRPRNWKKLQRLAYLFYLLMYVHIVLINLSGAWNGRPSAILNLCVYSVLFISYGVLRIRKELLKKDSYQTIEIVDVMGIVILCSVFVISFVPAFVNQKLSDAGQEASDKTSSQESQSIPEPSVSEKNQTGTYLDGVYTGAGIGYNGRLTVEVTVESGNISQLRITSDVDDEPYITDAENGIFPAVLDAQCTDVDTVSGATSSSEGLLDAITDALSQATN